MLINNLPYQNSAKDMIMDILPNLTIEELTQFDNEIEAGLIDVRLKIYELINLKRIEFGSINSTDPHWNFYK